MTSVQSLEIFILLNIFKSFNHCLGPRCQSFFIHRGLEDATFISLNLIFQGRQISNVIHEVGFPRDFPVIGLLILYFLFTILWKNE